VAKYSKKQLESMSDKELLRLSSKPTKQKLEKLPDEELLNLASDKVLVDIKSTEKRTKPKITPRPIRPKPSIVSPPPEVQTMTEYDDSCTVEIVSVYLISLMLDISMIENLYH
jgi:hypothetical protein